MVELKFDSEGVTYCPKYFTATIGVCNLCDCCLKELDFKELRKIYLCSYEEKFPEPVEVK